MKNNDNINNEDNLDKETENTENNTSTAKEDKIDESSQKDEVENNSEVNEQEEDAPQVSEESSQANEETDEKKTEVSEDSPELEEEKVIEASEENENDTEGEHTKNLDEFVMDNKLAHSDNDKTMVIGNDLLEQVDINKDTNMDKEDLGMKALNKKELKKYNEKGTGFSKFKAFLVIFYFVLVIGATVGGLFALNFFYTVYRDEAVGVTTASFYKSKQSTSIYDIDGNFITAISPNYVEWVDIEDIPEYYTQAVVATEDSEFYNHNGVDYESLVKGLAQTLAGNDRGASTITMQLGKVLYMEEWYIPDENGVALQDGNQIEYKLLQMSYAMKIEEKFTKDEILENYINSINYGSAYGIEQASQYYFGHSASELTLSESALLAGIPQKPTSNNPYNYPENATDRRNVVLESMLVEGYITQEQYDEEIQVDIETLLIDPDDREEDDTIPYIPYLDIVQRELEETLTENAPETNEDEEEAEDSSYYDYGIKVYTYLDADLQETNYIDGSTSDSDIVFQDEYIQVGMTQLDTETGAIYSVVNGRGERGTGGTNFAYNYYRQPGSTSKPIIDYGPAIEYLDWSTYHTVEDSELTYRGTDASVTNSAGNYIGDAPIQTQVGESRNTPAVRTYYEVVDEIGYNEVGVWLDSLGISDIPISGADVNNLFLTEDGELPAGAEYYPYDAYSIGGWDYGTTPTELAGAYAAFGNGGTYNEPHTINYIEVDENSIYYDTLGAKYEYEYESNKVMGEDTSYLMTQMLDVDNTSAAGLAGSAANGPSSYDAVGHYGQSVDGLSAKTGTTNWDDTNPAIAEGTQRDRWVAGYTKDVTTVVWTGYETEYEQQGYYLSFSEWDGGNDVYELFHVFTWNAEDNDGDHLHDAPELAMPDNVSVEYYEYNSITKASGSTPYYFISGSEDDLYEFEPSTPEITNATVSGSSANISWSYQDENDVEFNVYIDGKLLTTTESSSISISQDDFVDVSGCNSNYSVTVSGSVGGVEGSTSSAVEVDFGSDEFCQEPEPEEEEEETTDTEETTETEEE